jgi:hypothetical protein
MFILVLNQSNITPDGQNSELVYRFPNSVVFKDKYIAVSSIAMFYSWFNIVNTANNNTLTYTWTNAAGNTTTYTITIPNGLYQISEINSLIQFTCINNGTFWTVAGVNFYPFEILVNAARYAIQLNTYLIPTSAPAGATLPSNFKGWPNVAQNSQVSFPAQFNLIVGYPADFISNGNVNNAYVPPSPSNASQSFVSKLSSGTLSYLSAFAPQVQPNNNVLFSISNINNPYSQPSSIIYSLCPTVSVGQQINETPPNFMWNKLIDGTYNELRLQLLGTDKRRLQINDPNMTILLAIRDKIDIGNL